MASYHLSAKVFSRGQGHSAVAAASYRARCALTDERTGELHDYSGHHSRCIWEGIFVPRNGPEWARDRSSLWNHVEAFEKHHKAELAREYEVSLPHEMTDEQRQRLLTDYVREQFTRKGMIADVAIHEPEAGRDERNVHAHILVVMRKLDGSEFVKRKDQYATWTEKQQAKVEDLMEKREAWAKLANRHLERHGYQDRIDHRSLDAQGIDREPTRHLGKSAAAMERRGVETYRGEDNREIANDNSLRAAYREKQAANERAAEARTRRAEADARRNADTAELLRAARQATLPRVGDGSQRSRDDRQDNRLVKPQSAEQEAEARRAWTGQQRQDADRLTRDELEKAQRAGIAAADRKRDELEAENTPQRRHARLHGLQPATEAPELTADAIRDREARDRQFQRGTAENDLARAAAELARTDPAAAARMGWRPGERMIVRLDPVARPQGPLSREDRLAAEERVDLEADRLRHQQRATERASRAAQEPARNPGRDMPAPAPPRAQTPENARSGRVETRPPVDNRSDFERGRDEAKARLGVVIPKQQQLDEQELTRQRERDRERGRERHHSPFRHDVLGHVRKRQRHHFNTHGGGAARKARPTTGQGDRPRGQPHDSQAGAGAKIDGAAGSSGASTKTRPHAPMTEFRRVTMTPPPLLSAGATPEQLRERIEKLKELASGDAGSNYGAELTQLRRRHFEMTGTPGG